MNCVKCKKDTQGFKCENCGEEAAEHDPNHTCGGKSCVGKCVGCNEAETKCSCEEVKV